MWVRLAAVVLTAALGLGGAGGTAPSSAYGCQATFRPGFGFTAAGEVTVSAVVFCQNGYGQTPVRMRYATISACFVEGQRRVCSSRFGRNALAVGTGQLTLPCVVGGPTYIYGVAVVQMPVGWFLRLDIPFSPTSTHTDPSLTCPRVTPV